MPARELRGCEMSAWADNMAERIERNIEVTFVFSDGETTSIYVETEAQAHWWLRAAARVKTVSEAWYINPTD